MTKRSDVHLEKVTYDNVGRVHRLRVTKEQKNFVASNDISLIEAFLTLQNGDPVFPFAIYHGKTVVGFLMMDYDDDWSGYENEEWLNSDYYKSHKGKPYYYIWRFMIDKRFQRRGYGREALKLALDFARSAPCGKAEYCALSYEPENIAAKNLYASAGFTDLKETYVEGEEIYAVAEL